MSNGETFFVKEAPFPHEKSLKNDNALKLNGSSILNNPSKDLRITMQKPVINVTVKERQDACFNSRNTPAEISEQFSTLPQIIAKPLNPEEDFQKKRSSSNVRRYVSSALDWESSKNSILMFGENNSPRRSVSPYKDVNNKIRNVRKGIAVAVKPPANAKHNSHLSTIQNKSFELTGQHADIRVVSPLDRRIMKAL